MSWESLYKNIKKKLIVFCYFNRKPMFSSLCLPTDYEFSFCSSNFLTLTAKLNNSHRENHRNKFINEFIKIES